MPKPPIVLVPHDPQWARAFEEARAAIVETWGGYVLDVLHVGSTAIPGIAAKPVIDMMPLLRRHEDGFACVSAMAALGFEFRGEAGLSGRHFFRKGDPRTHRVHMFASDHPEVGRHIPLSRLSAPASRAGICLRGAETPPRGTLWQRHPRLLRCKVGVLRPHRPARS